MTAPHIVDPQTVLTEALGDASPDLMRDLLQTMINALLSADADAVVGAEWGKPSPDRVTQRNGYRHRDLDTRVGTIDVAIPKLRQGTYFPEWLMERRKRAESALITVVADCYLAVERASALAYFAALAVAEGDPRRPLAVAMAAAAAGDCARLVGRDGLQLHGGIGFTWEHDLHFHLKRAVTGELLFGTAAFHRTRAAELLGLATASEGAA